MLQRFLEKLHWFFLSPQVMTDEQLEDMDVYVAPHGPVVPQGSEGYVMEQGKPGATAGRVGKEGDITPTSDTSLTK